MVQPQDDLVLIRVRAFNRTRNGVEFCGEVEGVGERVSAFKPGDQVHGNAEELFADYVCVSSGSIRLADDKPQH